MIMVVIQTIWITYVKMNVVGTWEIMKKDVRDGDLKLPNGDVIVCRGEFCDEGKEGLK